MNLRFLLRALLVTGSLGLTFGVFAFSQQMISRLSEQVTATSRVLAQFLAQSSFAATRNIELQRAVSHVIHGIDFPVVITDTLGTPRAWWRISVSTDLVPPESLDSLDMGLPIAPVIRERIDQVRAEVVDLDRRNAPIEMRHGSGILLGFVHYGAPRVVQDLRWVPFVSVGGVLLLVLVGYAGLAALREAERRTIWVGMAKETAHQLGTPLSSIMGWIELMRGHAADTRERGGGVPVEVVDETVHEIERDVARLNKVAQRFSQVGSKPECVPVDVRTVAAEVVSYMRKRVPGGERPVVLEERYADVPKVMANVELLAWALENLIANSVTAFDSKGGRIEVAVAPAGAEHVEITVTDGGRGMSPAEQRRVFEPGYTTKRRGWGLGLPLARRVIQEYHGGRIYIRRSAPGQGTVMAMRLRVA